MVEQGRGIIGPVAPHAFSLVVFDVAGTTVLDGDIVIEAMDAALIAGGVTVGREAARSVMGIPKPLAIARLLQLANAVSQDSRVDRIHDDFLQRLHAKYQSHPSVREAEGARETFRQLRQLGIKVALDTGFDRPTLDVLLTRLGWIVPDVLDCTVSSDEVIDGRPGPDLIRRAMQLTAVSDPRHVVKVGDTPSDLESGRSAGCGLVVGVSYGTHSRAELLRHHPSAVIDDLRALLPLIVG